MVHVHVAMPYGEVCVSAYVDVWMCEDMCVCACVRVCDSTHNLITRSARVHQVGQQNGVL